MAYTMNNNSGFLFKNERANGNPNAPMYAGNVMVNGKEMRISAWVKETRDGKKYFSLSFSEPYQQQNAAPSAPAQQTPPPPQAPAPAPVPPAANPNSLEPQVDDLPF